MFNFILVCVITVNSEAAILTIHLFSGIYSIDFRKLNKYQQLIVVRDCLVEVSSVGMAMG
jgi:hypothetical protein